MKISIITVCYNSAATIRDTIESVLSQTYPDIEYIIIDGASTDATMSIVAEYKDRISRIVSEPDQGIYDAMNKGISLASGDVVGILNSDDYYPHSQVLDWVIEKFADSQVDACYGDLQYVDFHDTEKVVRHWGSGSYNHRKFYQGWMPPHPTFFVRSIIYKQYGNFHLDLGSSADYELILRFLLKHKINAVYVPRTLVRMRSGGTSNVSVGNRLQANKMDRKAWDVNGLKPYPWTLYMKPLRKLGQFLFPKRRKNQL